MFSTVLTLISAAVAIGATPAAAKPRAIGPITAEYRVTQNAYCVRSGWNSASFQTNRRVRQGECRTAADWRNRGIAFDESATAQARRMASRTATAEQVATR